jgi:hypothetical protein
MAIDVQHREIRIRAVPDQAFTLFRARKVDKLRLAPRAISYQEIGHGESLHVAEYRSRARVFRERAEEQRVLHLEGADRFEAVATLPLGGGSQLYLVLRRTGGAFAQRTRVWNSAESATLAAPSPCP